MSSKAAKRRAEFQKREKKRQVERDRQKAILNAEGMESLAKAFGIRLR